MTLDERELFTHRYNADPDRVWAALKRALATWDLRAADDAAKAARFDTSFSWTSWGEHMLATVVPEDGGSRLVVRGRPKSSLLTTKTGEDIHAREVETNLLRSVEDALAAGS